MSTPQDPQPLSPPPVPPPPPAAAPRWRAPPRRLFGLAGLLVVLVAGSPFVYGWIRSRLTESLTDDAFVEAHLVNVAPEMVSGRIVRFLVEENDRVEQGQVLAEIDSVHYRDQVELARSKLDAARAELRRQEAALDRLRLEVPLQIEIARRTLAAARADQAKAEESHKLTQDEVDKGIDEARAGQDAAKADLVLAQQEYTRFTNLYQDREAVPLRRSQEATRSRDAAQAQVNLADARLARALAARTRIEVSRREVEAARAGVQKADKGVDLAETGRAQIRETELLTAVKQESVEEARRALTEAEDQLKYTQVRAPFPGVVVKRFRNLGDFASPGVAVLSMYNPDLLYVTANLEETRLPGVAPGNPVRLDLDAFARPFRGRVVWINQSTGAQFALMPRNVVSGEFTRVVQRVPVRIQIEKDERWPQLRAGLSVSVAIRHGNGDPAWAEQAARDLADLEARYNAPAAQEPGAGDRK
jgi:membrane fusion protein (multidrug efflux system)